VTQGPFRQVELTSGIGCYERGEFQPIELVEILTMELHGIDADADFGRFAECDQVAIAIAKDVT
jgi:hypothetical protein